MGCSPGNGRDLSCAYSAEFMLPLASLAPGYGRTRVVLCLRVSRAAVAMSNFDGLLVPRPTRMEGPSSGERAVVWTLVIESGHIPFRTRLGTCNRDLYGPLCLRHVNWVHRVMLEDMLRIWALMQEVRT